MYEIDPSRYTRHDSLIDAAAQRHRVSQALIKAVIMAESGFNAAAYREEPQIKDASRGLMQLL
ncbi:MAG TPA: transglycosylase SLT domain-containing protein, partial [Hyphomicrobiaceae bacterium]